MEKQKFPLLEQMRAARQQREDEITAPVRQELNRAVADIQRLGQRLADIERALGNGVAKAIESRMASELARRLMELVYQAAAKAEGPFEPVTVTFPPEIARFALPSTIEMEICRRYRNDSLPSLRLNLDEPAGMAASATVMDIYIPALGFRHVVENGH